MNVELFKSFLRPFWNTWSVGGIPDAADKIATAYELSNIGSSGPFFGAKLVKGNKEVLTNFLTQGLSLNFSLQVKTPSPFVEPGFTLMATGFCFYWLGSTFTPFPPMPPMFAPSPGASVIFPGVPVGFDKALKETFDNTEVESALTSFANALVAHQLTIKKGQRVPINVDYTPNGEAGVFHRDTIWWEVNATKTKLYSTLVGMGLDAKLIGEGATWQERVLDQWQTDQGITEYIDTVYVSNTGNVGATIIDVRVDGTHATNFDHGPIFVTEGGNLYNPLPPNTNKVAIEVKFLPWEIANSRDAEKRYSAELAIDYVVEGDTFYLQIPLEGIATQPRLSASGHDYGTVEVGSTSTATVEVFNVDPILEAPLNNSVLGTQTMELYELRIPNNAPFYFERTGTRVITFDPYVTVDADENQQHRERVVFAPTSVGNWSVPYEISYNGHMVAEPLLIGNSVNTIELSVSDDSVSYWYNNTTTGQFNVFLSKTGNVSISQPFGADALNFKVVGWSTAGGALNTNLDNINVSGGIPISVHYEFTPSFVTQNGLKVGQDLNGRLPFRVNTFAAQIQITELSRGIVDTANIYGDGEYLETTAYIPSGYTTTVGDVIDIFAYVDELPERVNVGGVDQFRVRFSYEPELLNPIDPVLAGTQTDGWEIIKYELVGDRTIEIDVKNKSGDGTALVQSTDPVIGMTYQVLLTDLDYVPLPIQLYWLDVESTNEEDKQYVVFNNVPGDLQVDLTCAGQMRIVSIGDANYFIDSKKSVVSNNIEIDYGVGIDAPVDIQLVDVMGNATTVVHGNQKAGEYNVVIDATDLPNGVYFITYRSGDYVSPAIKVIKQK